MWFDVDTPTTSSAAAALPANGAAGVAPETTRLLESWDGPAERYAVADHPSRPVYANKWIAVREDFVVLTDARRSTAWCRAASVGLLPFLGPDTVLLVRCTGTSRDARRGDAEAASTRGRRWKQRRSVACRGERLPRRAAFVRVSTYLMSKSVVDDGPSVPRRGSTRAETAPDETEFIDPALPVDTVLRMVLDGEIVDGMTVTAGRAARRRDGRRVTRR